VRKLTPIALIGFLTVIALIAAIASIQTSPRFDYFAQPPSGTQKIIQEFHDAVHKTLSASSFREKYAGRIVVFYQAPNRTDNPSDGIEVIGHRAYFELSQSASGRIQWGEYPLTQDVNRIAGPPSVRDALQCLLETQSVFRTGDGYKAEDVVDADAISPGTAGQALIIDNVIVRNGFISRIHAEAYAPISSLKNNPGGTIGTVVLKSEVVEITYSEFGHVRPISAPKKNHFVTLARCTSGGTGITEIDNVAMCVEVHG
jgi:hypothetical protein